MGGGTPPSSSSQSLSQASETAIVQLRAFVRYELQPAPTDADLADALSATHSNVHAAYHLLRVRHQQQQQQAAMASPTPTSPATAPSPVANGTAEQLEKADKVVVHASTCTVPVSSSCPTPTCDDMRRQMKHRRSCTWSPSACFHCQQLKKRVTPHAAVCSVAGSDHCPVPLCDALRSELPVPAPAPAPSNKRRSDDSSASDAPSKRQRDSASLSPPIAHSLRLSSSQDAEMASPAASQQQLTVANGARKPRQPFPTGDEVHIVFSQRNLSQETTLSQDDDAHNDNDKRRADPDTHESLQTTAVESVVVAPVADVATAKDLLTRTIHDRRMKTVTDATWRTRFYDALGVASTAELTRRLELVCDALAAWQPDVDDRDAAARNWKALELVLDIATKLPRADEAGELTQRVVALEKNADVSELRTLQHELENPSASSARARSRAAEKTIQHLTDECAASLDRIVWFANARVANATFQADVRAQLSDLDDRLNALTEKCNADVRAGDSAVAESRHSRELQSVQLLELVQKRGEELIAGGESAKSAEVQASLDVLTSDDVEVVALIQSRTESGTKVRDSDRRLQKCKKELVWVQRAAQLFAIVRECREQALQAALTGFDASCAASDQRATDALLVCVPILVTALTKFYQFHATQQARAKKETGDLERKLDTHLEYFGDSAPTTTEDLQKRIREFVGVISRSTQTLLQLADAQSRLWETRKASLPPPVRQVVVREYGRLWRQLSGQFHDVMRTFVEKMRLDADDENGDVGASGADGVEEKQPAPMTVVATETTPLVAQEGSLTTFSTRSSQSSGAVASNAVSSKPSSKQLSVSPLRVVDVSMTQEVATFLRDAEPVSSTFAIASALAVDTVAASEGILASSPKALVVMPFVPPAPQIRVAPEPNAEPIGGAAKHRFPVGTVLFTKFDVGKNAHFVRGRVEKLLDDGTYSVTYENGDVFAVHPEFLHTEAQVERDLALHKRTQSDSGACSSNPVEESAEGICVVM